MNDPFVAFVLCLMGATVLLGTALAIDAWCRRNKPSKPNRRRPDVLGKPCDDSRSSIHQFNRIIGR